MDHLDGFGMASHIDLVVTTGSRTAFLLTIGALAKATGTKAETIRWYEREGILPVPWRTDGNYRNYGPEHLERLRFVRR